MTMNVVNDHRALRCVLAFSHAAVERLEQTRTPVFDFAIRAYVAQDFFSSGLTKLRDWSSTLALFNDIYQVPLLPPALAAYLGTAGELVLPVLLVLGLATRFAGAGLFVVNLMAVLSLMADDLTPAAQAQHLLWGVLAVAIALWGAGRWSLDRVLTRGA